METTLNWLSKFALALLVAITVQACAKSTSSTGSATGYPAISVKCGDQACVK